MAVYKTIEWLDESKAVRLLDQSRLPGEVAYATLCDVEGVAAAIRNMTVRGAPAIGVTAAYGLVVAAYREPSDDIAAIDSAVQKAIGVLKASRPTAVNLFWALDHMAASVSQAALASGEEYRRALLACAHQLAKDDIDINRALGQAAMALMPAEKVTFIHHCNTGSLATVEFGTALGVIRTAHEAGLQVHVFVDETRPRLQGARLTCWELENQGISHQLIVDGASSQVMKTFAVDMCVVGVDRVAANGDVANKIGTCNLAIVARAHGVPFYACAPLSSVDLATSCGADITIEERDPAEVKIINEGWVAPRGVAVYNPAFDVTPAEFITAIVTEKGVAYPPFAESLRRLKEQ
jgi:methylthioribose-1-phosphate isomerase